MTWSVTNMALPSSASASGAGGCGTAGTEGACAIGLANIGTSPESPATGGATTAAAPTAPGALLSVTNCALPELLFERWRSADCSRPLTVTCPDDDDPPIVARSRRAPTSPTATAAPAIGICDEAPPAASPSPPTVCSCHSKVTVSVPDGLPFCDLSSRCTRWPALQRIPRTSPIRLSEREFWLYTWYNVIAWW